MTATTRTHHSKSILVLAMVATIAVPAVARAAGGNVEHELQLLKYAVVNFIIFVGLITWKLRPVIRRFASTRYDEITSNIRRVEAERSQLQQELSAAEQGLTQAAQDAEALRKDLESASRAQAEKMLSEAQKQAEAANRSAEQQIVAAERQAQTDTLVAAAHLLAESVRQQLHNDINATNNSDLSERQLGHLGASAA